MDWAKLIFEDYVTVGHDHSLCRFYCPTKRYFDIFYKRPQNMSVFLADFFVPFESSIGDLSEVNILFIGEAGGFQEALNGRPFYPMAPAGSILRHAIKHFELNRYAIANIVGCRPVTITKDKKYKNRTPTESECKYCIDYLKRFITLLHPNVRVILLGQTAAISVLKNMGGYIRGCTTITPIVKLPPLEYKGRIYGANFHPRYIASGGGIKGSRYGPYLDRMEEILDYE